MKLPNIRVEQMTSPATNNPVANQFLIHTNDGTFFQSYNTVIAYRDKNWNVTLDTDSWNYSTTTSKYRNRFLGETTAQTKKKIANGTYTLASLNGN